MGIIDMVISQYKSEGIELNVEGDINSIPTTLESLAPKKEIRYERGSRLRRHRKPNKIVRGKNYGG